MQHPEGKIMLLDGSLIEGFPRQTPSQGSSDEPQLKDVEASPLMTSQQLQALYDELEALEKIFYENAFFLWSHTERILSDSRMFLAPIAVSHEVFGTDTPLDNLTLGVYIEWWNNYIESRVLNNDGTTELVWYLEGVPVRCFPPSDFQAFHVVNEQGKSQISYLPYFTEAWQSLATINHRYEECKKMYDAYSLEQVLDILHSEADSPERYAQFMVQAEIRGLQLKIKQMERQRKKDLEEHRQEVDRINDKYMKYRVLAEFDRLKKLFEKHDEDARLLREKINSQDQLCKTIKAHRKEYTDKEFQKVYMDAKRQKRLLENELSMLSCRELGEIFPHEYFELSTVRYYVDEITIERETKNKE